MNKQKVLSVLIGMLVVALAITITYGIQFYRAVQQISAFESPECAEQQY